jgi:hypothetical protein
MAMINPQTYNELEILTQKIEQNTANLSDYKRYETILVNAGLSRDYIFSYLQKAGFTTWNDFYRARNIKAKANQETLEAIAIGGLIGIGIGLLISTLNKD